MAYLRSRAPGTKTTPRLKLLTEKAKDENAGLPDLGGLSYMPQLMEDIGYHAAGEPLTWSEIKAWQELTMMPLTAFEVRGIHAMSESYLASYKRSDGEDVPPPAERVKDG